MDKLKANQLLTHLKKMEIEGINIDSFKDNGKSAAVYCGKKDDILYAVKIFDDELVERYGVDIQQQRINLELSLKDHKIDNLVKIFGGGHIFINKIEYFYLIMEYIEGQNLKKCIENNAITPDFIIKVITTLIEVTENLLKSNPPLAHRDIKPENIMISENTDVIVMDMGVLKVIGAPSMSDVEQKQFLGTLRYAPPEFLTRNENNTMEGWRAVNIYQIGAVLHDLIMKKELFAGIEPYASLVIAIKEDMPEITSSVLHPDLVQLARNMLHKDWKRRLVLSSTEIIKSTLQRCLLPQNEPINLYNEIKNEALPIQAELEKIESISRSKAEKEKIMFKIHSTIWNTIDESFNNQETNEIITKIGSSKPFVMDTLPVTMPQTKYRFYHIKGKFEYGFAKPFLILFKVENNENSYCKLSILGIIPAIFQDNSIEKPEALMYNFFSREKKYPPPDIRITNPPELNVPVRCFFDGIIEFADTSFKIMIDKTIAVILKKTAQKMKPDIQEELKRRKERVNSGPGVYVTISRSQGPVFIDIQEGRTLSF